MLTSEIIILVFISGIIVTALVTYGIYSHIVETLSDFEEKRVSKISYRTKEEFVGR